MKLSICIPTRNRSVFLNDTLTRLCEQVYRDNLNVEIVVSDNASEDDTFTVINSHNVRGHRNKRNLGFAGNLAKVVNLAKGEYCWLLGDDEVVSDHAVKFILWYLNTNPWLGGLILNYIVNEKMALPLENDRFFDTGADYIDYAVKHFNHNEWDTAKLTLMSCLVVNREMYLAEKINCKEAPHAFKTLSYMKDKPFMLLGGQFFKYGENHIFPVPSYFKLWTKIYWFIGTTYNRRLAMAWIIFRMMLGSLKWRIIQLILNNK